MKGIITTLNLLFSLILSIGISYSQVEIWGNTSEGAEYGIGSIFSLNPESGETTQIINHENKIYGRGPGKLMLLEGESGLLFGTCESGGNFGFGVIFSFDPSNKSYKELFHFRENTGFQPSGGVIEVEGKYLYGLTSMGGNFDGGTLYKFDQTSKDFEVVVHFNDSTGMTPYGHLTFARNGDVFGLTSIGGIANQGTLFEFDHENLELIIRHEFGSNNGLNPLGSLFENTDGTLYGFTSKGGIDDSGTLFSYKRTGGVFEILHEFDAQTDGSTPKGTPAIEACGKNLFGYCFEGGENDEGTLFEYHTETKAFQTHRHFKAGILGTNPMASPFIDGGGNIIGVTCENGPTGFGGALFIYSPSNRVFYTLYDFKGDDGIYTISSIVTGPGGKYYGTANAGGKNGTGTIFSFNPGTGTFNKEFDFHEIKSPKDPISIIFSGSSSRFGDEKSLFGISVKGGKNQDGAIFEIYPKSGAKRMLFSFLDSSVGSKPLGVPVEIRDGVFLGGTNSGGAFGQGTFFLFNSKTNEVSKVLDWPWGNHGKFSGHFQKQGNHVFGITQMGVFKLNLNNYELSHIHKFDFPLWDHSQNLHDNNTWSMVKSEKGHLYGIVNQDDEFGDPIYKVFEIFNYRNLSDFRFIKSFEDGEFEGYLPLGKLFLSKEGKMIGFKNLNRPNFSEFDEIFEYDLLSKEFSSNEIEAKFFNPNFGFEPGPYGNLYGYSKRGFSIEKDFIFKYDPMSKEFESVFEFMEESGNKPRGNLYLQHRIYEEPGSSNPLAGFDKYPLCYPNPFWDSFSLNVDQPSKVQVYDVSGKFFENIIYYPLDEIPISGPAGMYIVRVKNESGHFIGKVVKQ